MRVELELVELEVVADRLTRFRAALSAGAEYNDGMRESRALFNRSQRVT